MRKPTLKKSVPFPPMLYYQLKIFCQKKDLALNATNATKTFSVIRTRKRYMEIMNSKF